MPTKGTFVQNLNEEMRKEKKINILLALVNFLVAASAGKHYFQMPESLSEDCIRTAAVTINLSERPSSSNKTALLVADATTKFMDDIPSHNLSQHPMELYCELLNERFEKKVSDFPDFQELKKNVTLPKPAKNYYIQTKVDESTGEIHSVSFKNETDDDPIFMKFYRSARILGMSWYFRVDVEYVAITQAIAQLSDREAFKSAVDNAYNQILDDYIRDIFAPNVDPAERKIRFNHYPELKRMDEYFLKNSTMKEEYEKIKKHTIDLLNESRQPKA